MSIIGSNLLAGASGQAADSGYEIGSSLRFYNDDSASLNRTFGTSTNNQKSTVSFWIKRSNLGTVQHIWQGGVDAGVAGNSAAIRFLSDDTIQIYDYQSGYAVNLYTNQVFRDVSAWYHIVFAIDTTQGTPANRNKFYVNGERVTSFSTQTNYGSGDNPMFNKSSTNHYIGRYQGSSATYYLAGYIAEFNFVDGQQLDATDFGQIDETTGAWIPKEYSGSYGNNGFYLKFEQTVNLTTNATITAPFGGTAEYARVTDGLAVIGNTTTGSGFTLVQEDFGSSQTLSRYEVQDLYFTGGTSTFKLQYSTDGTSWTDGATFSVTASAQDFFGSLNVTARYVRIRATAFGTNGSGRVDSVIIYQDSFGADSSGNGNTWTLTNFNFFDGIGNDSVTDSPTNNFATLNRLDMTGGDMFEGNLAYAGPYSSVITRNGHGARSTLKVPSSGKWYVEAANITYTGSGNSGMLGFTSSEARVRDVSAFAGNLTPYIGANANVFSNRITLSWVGVSGGTANGTILFSSLASGDIVNFAIDFDDGKFWVGKNGTWYNSGNPAAGTNATCTFTAGTKPWAFWAEYVASSDNSNRSKPRVNFGQQGFKYTQPSGFLAMSTANLPEPTIKNGTDYFNTVLFSGNGSAGSVTGVGFQPDFIWAKNRTNAYGHELWDVIRGVNSTLFTQNTSAEDTTANRLVSFDSDGFSYGTQSNLYVNSTNSVAWNWKAGGSGTLNQAGSIDSTVSANVDAGFSIITYTGNATAGATIGHGLNNAPKWLLIKRRNGVDNWICWHHEPATTTNPERYYYEFQNTDTRKGPNTTFMLNGTAPTDSVITLYSDGAVNANGGTFVCYAWAEVEGFSKFGTYTGTGSSTDGPYIHCGFSVAFVIVKRSSSTEQWAIYDDKRKPENPNDKELFADDSVSEYDGNRYIDLLSNGFRPTSNGATTNTAGATYIFMAFAEHPFKHATAR